MFSSLLHMYLFHSVQLQRAAMDTPEFLVRTIEMKEIYLKCIPLM